MLTIGKMATLAEVSADTLRYYEEEGLIAPTTKSGSGYRLYGQEAIRRISFIKHAQQCGFTLSEIRELLVLRVRNSACCNDVRRLAVERKLQLEARIKAMKLMSKALDHLIVACAVPGRPVGDCPILAALDQANGAQRVARRS